MNELFRKIEDKSFAIRLKELDKEIIEYLDNSDTKSHCINNKDLIKPTITNLLVNYPGYDLLRWSGKKWSKEYLLLPDNSILTKDEFKKEIFMSIKGFSVGDKVICINDTKDERYYNNERYFGGFPVKGQVYTIDGMYTDKTSNGLALHLKEICNVKREGNKHPIGFDYTRFKTFTDKRFTEFLSLPNNFLFFDIQYIKEYFSYQLIDGPIDDWAKAHIKQKIYFVWINHETKQIGKIHHEFILQEPVPIENYIKSLNKKEETKLAKLVELDFNTLKHLNKTYTYKVYADNEECFLRYDFNWQGDYQWCLHSDKFDGAACKNRLKKYVWNVQHRRFIENLKTRYSIKNLIIDLNSMTINKVNEDAGKINIVCDATNNSKKDIKEGKIKVEINPTKTISYEKFLALPDGQNFIVNCDDEKFKAVKKSFAGKPYLCSNDSRFGRNVWGEESFLKDFKRIWDVSTFLSFEHIAINNISTKQVKVYLDDLQENDNNLTYEQFLTLPARTSLIVVFENRNGFSIKAVTDRINKNAIYLCSNDSDFGRTPVGSEISMGWKRVWAVGNKDQFNAIALKGYYDVGVKIYFDVVESDGCFIDLREHYEFDSGPYKPTTEVRVKGQNLDSYGESPVEFTLKTLKNTGINPHLIVGSEPGIIEHFTVVNTRDGIYTAPERGIYSINGKIYHLAENQKVDLSEFILHPRLKEANDWMMRSKANHYNKHQGFKQFWLRGWVWSNEGICSKLQMTHEEWNRYMMKTDGYISYEEFYNNRESLLKKLDEPEESYFNKLKRKIKNMFEPKTIVEGFEVVDIHPDFVAEIGKKIASRTGISYKEKDGKFFILKGSVFPVELTVESLKDLIVDRIKGKVWEDVLRSDVYAVAVEMDLIDFISFRRPKKNLLEMIK